MLGVSHKPTTLIAGVIAAGTIFAVWAIPSNILGTIGNTSSAKLDDVNSVGLMVMRIDSVEGLSLNDNLQKKSLDDNSLVQAPILAVAFNEADRLANKQIRAYQEKLTASEADTIMKLLPLQYTNSADNYDNDGNKIGTVDLYSYPVEFHGKLYGVILVFQN